MGDPELQKSCCSYTGIDVTLLDEAKQKAVESSSSSKHANHHHPQSQSSSSSPSDLPFPITLLVSFSLPSSASPD